MERDWELIRRILLALEGLPETRAQLSADAVEGYSADVVSYHMQLMDQAGLVTARCTKLMNGQLSCFATGLTWCGHEFLDGIRSQTAWNAIRKAIREKGLALSFDVIKLAVAHFAGQMFK